MPRKHQETEEKPRVQMRRYSDEELQKFHNLVQKYYVDHTIQHGKDMGEVIRLLDRNKLMFAFGATNEKGAILLEDDGFGEYKRPTRFEEFENLFEQWQWWKVKTGLDKNSAGHKKLEQLDEMAQQMKAPDPIEEFPF